MRLTNPLIWIIIVIAFAIGLGMGAYITSNPAVLLPNNPDDGVACTQEAKMCSDGSAVGRSGPRCEFTACPGE
ncbi:MAG: hypothetical protein AAB649_01195 [Patescibacteria group bacterium]